MPGLKATPLARDFFIEPPDLVAPRLLGKILVRRLKGRGADDRILAGRIVEVEAYFGTDDPAAHAFAGRTVRNAVLFGPPGHAYVYFIYGMHYCLNFSCEPDGQAGCVLVRALEPLVGLEDMARLRNLPSSAAARLLTSGPGRLCQAFGINRGEHDGVDVTQSGSPLYVAEDDYGEPEVAVTPRIGIRKAAERPLRFVVQDSVFVTGARSKPGRSNP